MKTSFRTTLAFATIAFVFAGTTSCKKPEPVTPPKTKTELLTQAGWLETSYRSKTNNGAWVDGAVGLPCEEDNKLFFSTAFKVNLDEGATKCDMMDPQNLEVGIWAFNNNEAELSIAETGSTFETATITTLNETTLQLLYAETVSGNTYITEIIYSH